jgi:hypothetical protein
MNFLIILKVDYFSKREKIEIAIIGFIEFRENKKRN